MQKLTKILALMLVLSLVFISSCKKDEETPVATKEDAQQVLQDAYAQMGQDMQILESDGMKAMTSLSSLDAPMIGEILGGFDDFGPKSLKLKTTKGDAVDFGTFTYNPDYCGVGCPGWDYSATPADDLVFVFPAEGSLTNNATLTISSIELQEFSETDEYGTYTWEQPTSLVLDLVVDGVTQVEINFSAIWNSDGDPVNITLDAYLNPYDINFSLSVAGSAMTVTLNIAEGSTTMVAANITATFEGVAMEDAPINVSGYIQYGTLKFEGSINIKALEELDNPTAEEINTYFKLSLYENSAGKLGDFMAMEIDGKVEPVFVYNDGTVAENEPFTAYLTAMIKGMFEQPV